MFFTSAEFIVFFSAVWLLWWRFPDKRDLVITVSGLFFLASFGWLSAFICVALSTANFLLAFRVRQGYYYLGAQMLNVLSIPLAGYLAHRSLFFDVSDVTSLWMAAGISFYNLQHYAYLSEVKKRTIEAETDLINYLAVSVYFPKALSGPITFYHEIKPQFSDLPVLRAQIFPGINRIVTGFFKKMVLADGLAPSVSSVFDHNDELPGITIIAGAVLFSLQLYFDFSGYCDMAIGFSRLLGITLPENFLLPFRASSMTDFWRRWHVTLLKFLTHYVFLPLSFHLRRFGRHGVALSIAMVFLISAVWHGWGITFLLWGISHTVYMLAEHYLRRQGASGRTTLPGVVLVFFLFSFSNVFFRSPGADVCIHKLSLIFGGSFLPAEWDVELIAPLAVGGHQMDLFNFCVVLVFSMLFLLFERRIFTISESDRLRPLFLYGFVVLTFVFGVFGDTNNFIYMQF